MVLPRQLRAAIFAGLAAFICLGPAYPQVYLGTPRSSARPWLPMAWAMYHSVGTDLCQADFWAMRDGQRVDLGREELEKRVARQRGTWKYDVGRKVRERDLVWSGPEELPEIARLICAREPDPKNADVRAFARCSVREPGPWTQIASGDVNLCGAR